jgi:hypothetical protein
LGPGPDSPAIPLGTRDSGLSLGLSPCRSRDARASKPPDAASNAQGPELARQG